MQVISGTHANLQAVAGCFALIVANPNAVPVKIRLRRGHDETDGAPYARMVDVDGRRASYSPLPASGIPPRSMALVFSLHVPADIQFPNPYFTLDCPATAFIEAPAGTIGNGSIGRRGQAIELLSEAPVFVLNVDRFQMDGGTEPLPPNYAPWAWTPHTLYPVHLWRSTTINTGVFKPGRPDKLENPDIPMGDGSHYDYDLTQAPGRTSVIAASEQTQVVFPELEGAPTGMRLERGEMFTFVNNDALVGRSFVADKPIALVNAVPSPIPYDFPFGDEADVGSTMTQTPPEPVWGSEYVAVRHADRWKDVVEEPPWRIIGAVDGTRLAYEPQAPPGAPHQLDRGELAIFEAGEPFIVRSQDATHPFFFGGHMTGGHYVLQRNGRYPNDIARGAPVSTNELATSRWAKRYPFFALLNWPEQSLVVVRRRGGKDVLLDCAGTLDGWKPAGTRYEYTYVPLTGRDLEPIAYGTQSCNAGPHWIESEEPFRATLWALTTSERVEISSVEGTWAYAVPLLGADGPTASTQ